MSKANDKITLRKVLTDARRENGAHLSMTDLTVLNAQNDPFRQDTPARHRDGGWLATQIGRLGLTDRPIHLRGLHYALLGSVRPGVRTYVNDNRTWGWLQKAAKAARWLGYVEFEQIVDHRNDDSAVRVTPESIPDPTVTITGWHSVIRMRHFDPQVTLDDVTAAQPVRLVLWAEKSSAGDVLAPLARQINAELYLGTGETSDTLIYNMARDAAADGRPLVIASFADSDPAGWQMPISIARKLQALRVTHFPALNFRVLRGGLTPDQVATLALPSTPLKASERRSDAWLRAWGVEQTELDALTTLAPETFRQMVIEAVEPYVDLSLIERTEAARDAYVTDAQEALDASIDDDARQQVHDDAQEALDALREAEEAAEALVDDDLDLGRFEAPEALTDEEGGLPPLIDSRWSWGEATQRLRKSRRYERLAS